MANIETITVGEDTYNILAMPQVSYSTTEQNTGITWIDGKSLYQKTVKVTPTATGVEIARNVDTFVNAPQIIRLYASGNIAIVTDCGTNNNNFICFKKTNNVLFASAVASAYNAGEATITIQYTKTTDV